MTVAALFCILCLWIGYACGHRDGVRRMQKAWDASIAFLDDGYKIIQ